MINGVTEKVTQGETGQNILSGLNCVTLAAIMSQILFCHFTINLMVPFVLRPTFVKSRFGLISQLLMGKMFIMPSQITVTSDCVHVLDYNIDHEV